MTLRKEDEGLDWRIVSKVFLMPLIGLLLGIVGWFILMKLSDIEAGLNELKLGQAGIMRDNQLQDEKINTVKNDLQDHINSSDVDRKQFEVLREDYFRRFGYISTTRSGKEILLPRPIQ